MSYDNPTKRSSTKLNENGNGDKDTQVVKGDILKQILETVTYNKSQLADLTKKIDNLETRYNDLSSKYEELDQKYMDLNCKYEDLIAQNDDLRNKYLSINKNIDRINQQALNTNIEIAGVPMLKTECPKKIAQSVLSKIGFPADTIVKSAYRRLSKNTIAGLPKTIIVTISDKGQRDKILAASRKIKNLNTSILSEKYEPQLKEPSVSNTTVLQAIDKECRPIYINEHLTDFNKYLLARAKNLRRSGKVFAVYARNGFVIVKQEPNSSEIRIVEVGQLDGFT